jgi:hypothetical protein
VHQIRSTQGILITIRTVCAGERQMVLAMWVTPWVTWVVPSLDTSKQTTGRSCTSKHSMDIHLICTWWLAIVVCGPVVNFIVSIFTIKIFTDSQIFLPLILCVLYMYRLWRPKSHPMILKMSLVGTIKKRQIQCQKCIDLQPRCAM